MLDWIETEDGLWECRLVSNALNVSLTLYVAKYVGRYCWTVYAYDLSDWDSGGRIQEGQGTCATADDAKRAAESWVHAFGQAIVAWVGER
jgi:hypothetical protein